MTENSEYQTGIKHTKKPANEEWTALRREIIEAGEETLQTLLTNKIVGKTPWITEGIN